MEAETVTFQITSQEIKKAHLTFSTSSKRGRLQQRFTFPLIFVILFLITFKQYSSSTEVVVNGQSTFWGQLYISAFISLFLGWFISAAVKAARENSIIQDLKTIPIDYFGEVKVTFDQTKFNYHAPLLNIQYNWRLLDNILVTPEFLFLCSGKGLNQRLVFWLPIKAVNGKASVVISNIEKWISDSKPRKP